MRKEKLLKEFSFGMEQAAVKLQQRKANPSHKLKKERKKAVKIEAPLLISW